MRRFAIAWAAAAGLLAAGFFLTGASSRADVDKDMHDSLANIAKALQSGDKAKATALAKAYAGKVEDLEDLMHAFKPRKSKGLGWGSKKGVVDPDGIEKKLDEIADKGITADQLKKEAPGLEEGAWMTAAIAEVTLAKLPEKEMGKKTRKAWIGFSNQMRDEALALAKAAKAGGVPAVKATATKLNSTCNNCHSIFKPGAGG